ncbi:YuzD family protein [Neobacillus kokaensis]|uniref:Disulfide oxidoreductase YuzD n=1 Tax=Neobacillus kokaensis TaxID=2759023 RepID=A0ABQ3N0K7_9BACI|nr:YuzD family protein [Neobacillus kokaensis]GHH97651.1 putative disulfide oxidoreductase YuzD [Neobacillus kokaensis]
MDFTMVEIVLYGAEQLCPSCVNLPSSKETYEWLGAAIARKFPEQPFKMSYVDIYQPPEDNEKGEFAKRVIEEDMFYPVVVIKEKVVGEGNPRLKTIFAELEKYGYKAE